MLIKLRFIGLLLILSLSSSIFGQDYRSMSLNELTEDLTYWHNVVDQKDWWFFKKHDRYGRVIEDAPPVFLRRNEGVRIEFEAKYGKDFFFYHSGGILSMDADKMAKAYNRSVWEIELELDAIFGAMLNYSDKNKEWHRKNTIPTIEDAIRNHQDNPFKPIVSEESGATECHSIGSGSYMIGDKNTLGTVCTYYSNGRLSSETQYAHNKKHGLQRLFYNTGDLSAKGDNFNGKKVGVWRYPYRPGTYENIKAYCREYDDNGISIKLIPSC